MDVIVNNAGSARGADRVPVVDLPLDVWRSVIDINRHRTFYMSRTFAQRVIAQGEGGVIINISSIGGKLMPADAAAYAASKTAIHSLTSSMAEELGRYNIRVSAICPGIIDTSRMDDVARGEPWDRMVSASVPLGRAGTGQDIAWNCVYLWSDQGAWVTGQSWNVDGGHMTAH